MWVGRGEASPRRNLPVGVEELCCQTAELLEARPINAAVAWQVPETQRGFIPGRSAEQNIMDVDTAARATAVAHADHDPVLLAFDTAAAFPTLARQAIDATLRNHALPDSIRTFVRATFAGGRIAMAGATREEATFRARAGVPQGCPVWTATTSGPRH